MTDRLLTKKSLLEACNRLEDFYVVQKSGGETGLTDAVTVLRESYGLDDDLTNAFADWVTEFCGDGYSGTVTLGLLIGLMAVDLDKW